MLSNRRLARLEASLSPRQATLVWLAEAQRFGSLAAYAASLVDQPVGMLPLVAVPQQARRAVRGTLRGQPRNLIAEREQEAFHEAPFLVQLVIELDRATRTTLRRAELRWMALWSDWRAHQSHAEAPGEPTGASRRALDDLWIMFSNAQHARTLLEHRYLAGRGALFPDTLADWQDLCAGVQLLAGVPTTPVCRCQRHTPGSGAGGLDRRDHAGGQSGSGGGNRCGRAADPGFFQRLFLASATHVASRHLRDRYETAPARAALHCPGR